MRDSLGNTIREKPKIGVLHKGEVAISEGRLSELEAKERAHDAYLRATQRMRERRAEAMRQRSDETVAEEHRKLAAACDFAWKVGWLSCLNTFSNLVVEESRNGG